jgi:hypothetical protein
MAQTKTKTLKGFKYSENEPKAGDVMICIQRKNINFGELEKVTPIQVTHSIIDTTNWKVVENMEERKQLIVDEVIESLKEDFRCGDYTVLDELLKFIPTKNLVQSLSEETWEKFPEFKLKK